MPGGEFHKNEYIEEFKVRVKQTVWLIITKLDKAILKLKFLIAQLKIKDP